MAVPDERYAPEPWLVVRAVPAAAVVPVGLCAAMQRAALETFAVLVGRNDALPAASVAPASLRALVAVPASVGSA